MRRLMLLLLFFVASPVSAQSVLPQFKVEKTGTEKQLSIRDPQSGADVPVGAILNGIVIPPRTTIYDNPTLPGGLFGLDDGISLTGQVEKYRLSGTRTKAWIGRTITVDDGSTATPSGPATASYGLSIYAQRPNWNTSSITGEMDPVNIVVRQANGDSAGILSNILTRNGFGATIESYTGTADITGAPTKAVNVQLGVSNSRDDAHYGIVLQSVLGTGLTSAIRIAESSGTGWNRFIEVNNSAGNDILVLDGATEALLTKSVVPLTQYGGNLGASGLEYDSAYIRYPRVKPVVFSALPSPSGNAGMMARITDASAAITTFNQVVSAGGGSNTALLTSDGTNWIALSK